MCLGTGIGCEGREGVGRRRKREVWLRRAGGRDGWGRGPGGAAPAEGRRVPGGRDNGWFGFPDEGHGTRRTPAHGKAEKWESGKKREEEGKEEWVLK